MELKELDKAIDGPKKQLKSNISKSIKPILDLNPLIILLCFGIPFVVALALLLVGIATALTKCKKVQELVIKLKNKLVMGTIIRMVLIGYLGISINSHLPHLLFEN
jgi:hypothetical protein